MFGNEQFCLFLQIGCYSIALIGLTVAIRKVRPVSKFFIRTWCLKPQLGNYVKYLKYPS